MAEKFPGNYFDGQSAKPRQVSVEVGNRRLFLSSEDGFKRYLYQEDLHNIEEVGKSRMLLRFGKDGMELLDINSPGFVKLFKSEFPQVQGGRNVLERIAASGWRGVALISGFFIGAVLLIYFFAIPLTGDIAARVFPKQYEEELGAALFKNVIRDYKVDSAKTELVNELLKGVDFQTEYKLDIVVVDYDMKNAFAMPGGHIVVYSGILKDMKDYPELVALLSHEVSHVNKRHTLRAMFRSLSSYIFISILLNDVNGITTVVLENANSIKSLSFSRKLEKEADMEGLQILFHNKVNPNGMVDLFETLMKEGDLPQQMEFLSSHPVTENRINYIREKIKESQFTVEYNDSMECVWEKLVPGN